MLNIIVVTQDGTKKFTTVNEALKFAKWQPKGCRIVINERFFVLFTPSVLLPGDKSKSDYVELFGYWESNKELDIKKDEYWSWRTLKKTPSKTGL